MIFFLQIAARFPIFISKRACGIFLHHDSSYSNAQELENWKQSLNKMSDRLNRSAHLTFDVKNTATALIDNDLKLKNRAFILQSLFARKYKTAKAYAYVFKENYGLNFEIVIFLILITFCQLFPPTIQMLFLLRRIKRMINKRSYFFYKQYAKWLKTTSNED